jgi:tetratricopeptide (TPR) repeat protein
LAYHALNDFDNAIKDYNKALEFDPKNDGIYNNLGIAKMSKKDVEGAIENYNKALEINKNSTQALMNRSNAKIIKGDTRGAIQDLNSVIIIRPHYAGAYLNRGLARFEMNDYASALRDFDQCIKLEPTNALAFNNRGIVKQKLEDYGGAIMDYDMAIKLDPGMANAYFNRAMAREILHKPGFESDYQIAADLNPQYDLSRFSIQADQLAQKSSSSNPKGQNPGASKNPQQVSQQPKTQPSDTLQKKGSPPADMKDEGKEREEDIRRRRRLNLIVSDTRDINKEETKGEEDPLVQNRSGDIDLQPVFLISAFEKNSVNYERLQYYNTDLELLNKQNNYYPLLVITNKPEEENPGMFQNFILYFNDKIKIAGNSVNYLNRGVFNCILGNYTQSLDDLNKTIALDSTLALAFLSRGNCRLRMTEKIEKLPENKGQLSIRNMKSETDTPASSSKVVSSGDYDLILADYNKTVSLLPDFFFGYYNRAYVYLKMKKFDLATEDLNKAIALEPEFAEAWFNRGLTKIFQDDTKSAAVDLSKAGELGLVDAYSVIKRYCN